MRNKELPLWAQNLLASCPPAGKKVHKWIFITALKLHPYFPDKSELERVLDAATANCGREVPATEIEEAVRNSQKLIENPTGQTQPVHRWPSRNEEQIQAIAHTGPKFAELAAMSPVKWNDDTRHTEEIIDVLFPGNPLLCAGPKQNYSLTGTREEWRGCLENQQFIVPSPMSAIYGETKSGKTSMRTLANTGPRRFLIVEFDTGTFDQHAAVLYHLATLAPLVMVVHSGNKSLHGWFYCEEVLDSAVKTFFGHAVSLGADDATWTRCQWVRMPDGQRDNGKRQSVIYFNPKPLEVE